MPHELDRIRELAGLQQEAPAGGDQALAKEIAKLYKEMVEVINDNSDNPDDIESDYNWGYGPDDDEEARALMKAFNTSLEAGLQLVKKIKIERGKSLLGDESDWDPFHPQSERHDELKAMFAKYGKKFTEESAVQEAPAAGLTAQQKQGLDAINAKYGKYIGYGNGGSLPVEAMERAIDPGSTLWADDKEENELKAYMKKMGYKDLSDMEAKDEEYMDNAKLPISDAMADDLQKVLGDYNDNPGLAQAAKDYLGSLGETAAQPVNSSVEDTIQRARAQIESLESQLKEDYKKFQGMKPYKPKKK